MSTKFSIAHFIRILEGYERATSFPGPDMVVLNRTDEAFTIVSVECRAGNRDEVILRIEPKQRPRAESCWCADPECPSAKK